MIEGEGRAGKERAHMRREKREGEGGERERAEERKHILLSEIKRE